MKQKFDKVFQNTFDLVIADHTLFELENRFERLKTVRSLWYNVKPGGFLVKVFFLL